MNAAHYPYLLAMLGDAANRIPDDVAGMLEDLLAATHRSIAAAPSDGITLLGCLQRIRQVDAADGQPWPGSDRPAGQRMALARIDRAAAGLTFLLELLHAAERVRVDGDTTQQMDDAAREGLLLACRGLSEYVGAQLPTA